MLERYSAAERLSATTRLLSWSLAKSLTNAMLGMRVRDGALALSQLASAPGWSAAETRRRGITGASPSASACITAARGLPANLCNVYRSVDEQRTRVLGA